MRYGIEVLTPDGWALFSGGRHAWEDFAATAAKMARVARGAEDCMGARVVEISAPPEHTEENKIVES